MKDKGRIPEIEHATKNMKLADQTPDGSSNLLSLDSPFLSEPLVDLKERETTDDSEPPPKPLTASGGTPPYVSATTSLRTSPEPGQNFEALWRELDASSARGWCEDTVDVVVLRLQGLGLRMDVLDPDIAPFEGELGYDADFRVRINTRLRALIGDLKISLRSSVTGSTTPSVVLRIHEEDDGSCLWQVRSSDRELGLRVKELMK